MSKNIINSSIRKFINNHLDYKVYHYSHELAPEYQKYQEMLGKSIYELACVIKTSLMFNLDDKDIDRIFRHLKRNFLKEVLISFAETDIYGRVNYGAGVGLDEKHSYRTKSKIFYILLAKASELNFISLIKNIINLLPNELEVKDVVDYKTLLQEYTQSLKKGVPAYKNTSSGKKSHSLVFESICKIDGLNFHGSGNKKKAAEEAAAKNASSYFNLKPKVMNLVNNGFQIEDIYKNNRIYKNSNISEIFNINPNSNLQQAFIPSRYKKQLGYKGKSNRYLAIIGSYYIQYLKSLTIYSLAKKNLLARTDSPVMAQKVTSNKDLATIFETDLIKYNDLVFINHEDFKSINYQVDCIQALFALGFLESLYINIQYYKCIAADWIIRKLENALKNKVIPQKHITSLVTERCAALDFKFKFIKIDSIWHAKITNIITKKEIYIRAPYNKSTSLKKEELKSISGVILKSLDRLEGSYYEKPKNPTSYERQYKLFNYFFENLVEIYKNNDKLLKLQLIGQGYTKDYSKARMEDLIQLWESKELNIHQKAQVLYFIHKNMHLIKDSFNYTDYYFLPFVFMSDYDQGSFSIRDIYTIDRISDHNLEPNRTQFATKQSGGSNSHIPSKNIDTVKINKHFTVQENSKNTLTKIEELYKKLDLNELEELWANRDTEFDFLEQASVALSLIRYLKGIDIKLKSYKNFYSTEMISSLDLPSIYEVEIREHTHSRKESTLHNSKFTHIEKISDNNKLSDDELNNFTKEKEFIPERNDERTFIMTRTPNRNGQSKFRNSLIKKWKCCSITGCNTLQVLDAAHIAPYRGEKDNDIRNGLLLRTDIHRLFDAYHISVEPETLTIHVSSQVNDPTYQAYHGKKLKKSDFQQTSVVALEYHWLYFQNQDE